MTYNAEYYMHDLDKRALDALNKFPKFIKLQQAYQENVDEKAAKIQFLSTAIRLNENQMSEVYNLLPPICDKLGINVPELYLVKSKDINAATLGTTNPVLFVTSELVDKLSSEQISNVLAHECGHIACKHTLYHSLAMKVASGVDSGLKLIPEIRRFVTPNIINALTFWDRCSELSADRAAVLCEGKSDNYIGTLLKIHGYDENINQEEFIKQSLDLKDIVNESKANQAIEQMIVKNETHPLMATRAYECYEWANSKKFNEILTGTYHLEDKRETLVKEEVLNADVTLETQNNVKADVIPEMQQALEQRLGQVNSQLDRYTSKAGQADYAMAIACGLTASIMDSILFSDAELWENDISFAHKQVNQFIQQYARERGIDNERLKTAIAGLEEKFKVAQDNVWKGANIGVSASNHHLADLAHHPTPVGLISALVVQFLRIGTFVNREGEWHFIFVKTDLKDIVDIAIPAIITGFLNWLVFIDEEDEEESSEEIPKMIKKLAHLVASTPQIIEVAKCADNWFGHLVSDMGGSKSTAGGGMGIPGVFLSLLYEIGCLPFMKDSGLLQLCDELYASHLDLRHEMVHIDQIKAQTIPVIFNEVFVRLTFMIGRICEECSNYGWNNIHWKNVIPFNNRSVDRMIMVASMTFNVADTADATVRAALESGGNWVVFSGRFVSRYNYVGAGRAALSIVKEVSDESQETQLIHERMILMHAKTEIIWQQLQEFKNQLDEKISNYLVEDIESFMNGFDLMNEGLETGNSNLVIKGNVIIQKVLGRKPQFTNQNEFNELMKSDTPLEF